MLDVRRLRLLREVALRGTLAAVAAALHQSPSSVSQQLGVLEREAGVTLLRRDGRRLVLTPAAEQLVEHTAAVLERLELAETQLRASVAEVRGTVRLALFQSAFLALAPATLHGLTRDHPALRVEVSQREPETALYATFVRDVDLVVAEHYPAHSAPWHPGLDRVALTDDRIRLAVPPGWTHVTGLADVAAPAWVLEPHGTASRHHAEQVCRRAGFEPDARFETADLQAQVALVAAGHAVALLPDLLWAGGRPPVRLVDLPGDPRRSVFTACPASLAAAPAVAAVRAALGAAAARLSPP